MNANYFTRASLEESIIMMSGQKWSDYARTLAKPEQASADGYAAYLLDMYTEPQRGKLTGKALADYVAMHKTMKPEEKAFLLSHLSGQMRSVNVGQVAKNYSETVANFTEFQSSAFFSIANAIT